MLYVKVLNSEGGGVLLTKRTDDSKVSEIVLSTQAWHMLCRYQQDASQALEKNTIAQWTLEKISDQASLMLTVAPYNNMYLASIRIYAQGQATRQGISVGSTGFAYLRGFLNTSSEFQLGRSEYKRLVMEQVYEGHAKSCEGCVTDRGSQRDHICLRPPSNASELIRVTGVDPFNFQVALAMKCSNQKIFLNRPQAIYKLLHFNYRGEIEKEVVSEVDSRYNRHMSG